MPQAIINKKGRPISSQEIGLFYFVQYENCFFLSAPNYDDETLSC